MTLEKRKFFQELTDDVAPGSGESSGTEGGSDNDELKKLQARATKAEQEAAHFKKLNSQAAPILSRLAEWQNTAEGKPIVEKLLKGEPLTAKQEKKLEKQTGETSGGITKEDLEEFENRIEERIFIAFNAREDRGKLEDWASKEFAGYDGIKSSPAWGRRLNIELADIQNGFKDGTYTEADIPDEFKGDWVKWGHARAYAFVEAQNPQLGKKRRVGKTGKELEAEKISATTSRASSSGESTEELPEDEKEEILAIRGLGRSRTFGKSFSNSR